MFPLPDPVLNVLKSQPIGAAVLWTIRPPNSGFRFALAGAIQKFIFTAAWSKCGAISVKLLSALWAWESYLKVPKGTVYAFCLWARLLGLSLYCVAQCAWLTDGFLLFRCLVLRSLTRLRHGLKRFPRKYNNPLNGVLSFQPSQWCGTSLRSCGSWLII